MTKKVYKPIVEKPKAPWFYTEYKAEGVFVVEHGKNVMLVPGTAVEE